MPSDCSLGHMPEGRWTFDESVAGVFEDMLARSIPQYEVMREAVTALSLFYMQPNTRVLDLGCSEGGSIAPLVASSRPKQAIDFIGYETSPAMLKRVRDRFVGFDEVAIVDADLRSGISDPVVWDGDKKCSVVLSILTLQFLPVECRARIIDQCYKLLDEGGALIVVEKVIGPSSELNHAFQQKYQQLKIRNGYSILEIEQKKEALEGVLVPLQADWNVQILEQAGFSVDCFWRWMNFAGWLALK